MSDANSNKLSSSLADISFELHGQKWSSFWDEAYTPWDRGGPSVALSDLLSSRRDLVPSVAAAAAAAAGQKRPTALVPGCGRGHDALLLASFGYDVVGMDYAAAAMDEARANQRAVEEALERAGQGDEGGDNAAAAAAARVYALKEGVQSRGEVRWAVGDFFQDDADWARGATFDLIFDYTFLCALPPSARPKWAARMSRLLKPDTGRLVCLEFPSGKPLSEPGPPWGLTPDIYLALLSRPGHDVAFDEAGKALVPEARAEDNHLERLELIKPARTHKAGTNDDGTVRDWLHVWVRREAGRR